MKSEPPRPPEIPPRPKPPAKPPRPRTQDPDEIVILKHIDARLARIEKQLDQVVKLLQPKRPW